MVHLTITDFIDHAEERQSPNEESISKATIEQHIRNCGRCAIESSSWTNILKLMKSSFLTSAPRSAVLQCIALYEPPKPAGIFQEIFARLVFDSASRPALVGVRGVAEPRQILLQADEMEVHLRISPRPRNILGQLIKRPEGDFIAGARMGLLQSGERVDVTLTDTLGEFCFNTVPDGQLRLQVDVASGHRMIADFAIKEEELN